MAEQAEAFPLVILSRWIGRLVRGIVFPRSHTYLPRSASPAPPLNAQICQTDKLVHDHVKPSLILVDRICSCCAQQLPLPTSVVSRLRNGECCQSRYPTKGTGSMYILPKAKGMHQQPRK